MKHFYTKPFCFTPSLRLLLFATLALFSVMSKAQISLTSTAGTLSANYTTLKAAIDNINNGTHQGVINIRVHANTTETAAITLVESGNASGAVYTSILVRPADTVTTVKTISINVTGVTLFTLNNADNVTFDGRPLSSGTQKLLSIVNPANIAASHTIALTNGATNNLFAYMEIASGSIGTIACSAFRIITGVNNNNTITNCTINGGNLGVEINGTNGTPNVGTIITNNLFINQKATAVRLAAGVGNTTIDSNNCTLPIATTTGGYQFINVTQIEPTATVNLNKNRVYDLNTAAANFIHGIFLNPSVNCGSLIARNNSFSLGSAAFPNTLSQVIRGVLFTGSLTATLILEHNTIRIGGTHITANGNPTTVGVLKSNTSVTSVFTMRNNLVINTRTGTANQHIGAFVSSPTTGTNNVDYNTYMGGGTFITAWIGTFYGSISAYRTAAAPFEQNSTYGVIDFNTIQEPSINLNGPNRSGANLLGTAIGVTNDYYGTTRSTTRPYRGAHEGNFPIDTADLQTVIVYTYGRIPIGTDDTVRALIRNQGAFAVTNVPVYLHSSKAGLIGSTNVTLGSGSEAIINLPPYTPSALGYDTLRVFPAVDQFGGNDTALWVRENTLNALSYSRPFVNQTGNVGTNPEGEIVAKFYTPVPNFLNQVNVNFTNAAFNGPFPFQVVIYEDSGSTFGPKMVPLWVSATQNTVNGVFNLSIPSISVSGYFYIGVRQTTANNIGFAFQNENPIRNRTFYFRQGTGFSSLAWNDFSVNPTNQFRFMIEPRLTINDDLGVTDLIAPGAGCVNLGTQAVTFEVQNLGLLTQNFATDTLRISGTITKPSGTVIPFGPVVVTSGTLSASATTNVVVIPSFNFDSTGAYTFRAWTKFGPDGNAVNDTLPALVRTVLAASSSPIIQNFNAATFPATWTTNRFFVSAGNGTNSTNCIRVNLVNTSPFTANAFVQSPRVSAITANSVLRFDYRILNNFGGVAATLINTDSIKVMVSTDCGSTFTQVALINGSNHSPSTNYITYTVPLGSFIGSDVIVKLVCDWFGTTNDAIVDIDNIRIVDGVNDVGGVAVSAPCRSVIAGSAAFAPEVTIRNFGSAAQSNVPVNVAITGPTTYNGTATVGSLAAGASSTITLSTNFNPATAGTYTLRLWTSLVGDGDASNDTVTVTFNVTNINQNTTASVNGINFGASSLVRVANAPNLNFSSSFTIETWVSRNAGPGTRTILAKDSALGFIQYAMNLNDSNNLVFFMNTNTNFYQFTSKTAVPTGFSHVAATFNGTRFVFYINGSVALDTTVASSTLVTNNYDLIVGNNATATAAFLGVIDELKLWNVARTEAEIRANMHVRMANASNANVVAYYRMDEGATNTFTTDASGNCNVGVFGNIQPTWTATQIPLGAPTVATQTVFVDGTVAFAGTNLSLVYTGVNGTDTVYVHKFTGAPLGTSPITNPGGVTNVHPAYWIAYRYGNATSTNTDVLFNLQNGNLNSGVTINDMRLFRRATTATGAWTLANGSASAVSFASQSVTFSQTQALFNTQLMLGANNNPLPVVLLNFAGTSSRADAVLRWATASESNNRGFALERSVDGKTYEQIAFIKGIGNSNRTNTYSYADRAIFTTTKAAYYRLKQVDLNGDYTYSDIVIVKASDVKVEQVVVYPNPMKSDLTVEIDAVKQGTAVITITDLTGKAVKVLNLNVSFGFNKYTIEEMSDLRNGLYFVTITEGSRTLYNAKIVKTE